MTGGRADRRLRGQDASTAAGSRRPARCAVALDQEGLEIGRAGTGLSMKLQAQDCANGGLFQMEPERADGTATRITHTLGPDAFYDDNPNFRAREGDVRAASRTRPRPSAPRDQHRLRPRAEVRRPRQPAGRHPRDSGPTQPCAERRSRRRAAPAASRPSTTAAASVRLGRRVSGGRMGGVFGEDAGRGRPARHAPARTRTARRQNQVQRRRPSCLGFPFPVPDRPTASIPAPPRHRGQRLRFLCDTRARATAAAPCRVAASGLGPAAST